MARLGDICEIAAGQGAPQGENNYCSCNEGTPFIKAGDLSDLLSGKSENEIQRVNDMVSKQYKLKLYPSGSILFAKSGMSCMKGYVYRTQNPCYIVSHLAIVVPNNIDGEYLKYYFQYNKPNALIKDSAYPSISLQDISNIEIKLPSLESQISIASKLNELNNLISLRKQQLSKLDELVKSRFIEMFGDLVIGDKISINKLKIGDIANVTKLAGFEFTKYIQYKEQGDIIMLRGLNCKKGHLVLDDIKWIDKETSDLLPRSKLYYGDILMTYAGTIGDVAMVDADNKYHLAPNVAKITLTDKMAYNPVFLIHLFMYTNDYIMTFSSVVAQASINMEKIRNFEYYFPSVELQNQFAAFVEQIDKSKFEIQKSLEKFETLKKALMQQYFG